MKTAMFFLLHFFCLFCNETLCSTHTRRLFVQNQTVHKGMQSFCSAIVSSVLSSNNSNTHLCTDGKGFIVPLFEQVLGFLACSRGNLTIACHSIFHIAFLPFHILERNNDI